jgi:UDPglucose--hexose-1-phosphate uridylyltransferase
LISKRHVTNLVDFNSSEKRDLAIAIKEITTRYDNLFQISFPYSSGIHQAPINQGDFSEWHWHMHFYPPLLRSATVKKFMVGYELLANPQRDITPEMAAEKLKNVSSIHYKEYV